jgi:hypothetical protein
MRSIAGLVLLWLLVGVLAAYQRDYFDNENDSCAHTGTVLLTVVAGPLNYAGANPKVKDCNVPQPSSLEARRHPAVAEAAAALDVRQVAR